MPNTTNRGWAKPDGSSTPDVPYWLGLLADNVDAALPDSGWVDLTSTVTPAAGMTTTLARARILNGLLEVLWNGTLTTPLAVPANGDTANTTVCTFPAPYRPGSHSRALAAHAGGPSMGWIITTAGLIQYVSGPPGLTAGVGSNLSCAGVMIQ